MTPSQHHPRRTGDGPGRAPDAGPRPRSAGAAGLRGLEESLRTRVDAYGGECAVRTDADRLRLEVLLPRR